MRSSGVVSPKSSTATSLWRSSLEAGSVADAVRRADLVRPDVILVDLQLPDGTGIDIMNSLRATHPQILPVVLTSFDDDEALAESLEAGAPRVHPQDRARR